MSFLKNRQEKKEESKELSIEEKAEKMRKNLLNIKDMPEDIIVKKAIEMCKIKNIDIDKDTDNNITLSKCYDILGDFTAVNGRGQEHHRVIKPFNSIALDVIKYYVPKSVWEDLNRIEDEDKVRELHTKLNIAEYK